MEYLLHIVVVIEIFAILAISLDLVAGQAGLLSLSHAAFFGIGAYASALLALHGTAGYLTEMVVAMATAIAASLLVSSSSIRLHGEYFLIATFGFQLIVFSVLNNWTAVTGGPSGLPGIPGASIFGWQLRSALDFAAVGALQLAIVYLVVRLMVRSPFGRVLRAIRGDEAFAQSLGKNTVGVKVAAFSASAALAASAGTLYAFFSSYIDPTSFTILDSVLILSMVLIGGSGTLHGPLIGAVVLVTLPELLRQVGISGELAGNLRQLIYGAALPIVIAFRPKGLVGRSGLDGRFGAK